jgi:hypothetical protein
MKGASGTLGLADAARLALDAGCDLLLFAFHDEEVRRARLELAKALVEGRIDRANFDAARPRLEALDRRRPEPGAGELARPIASLTPPDWVSRLEGIIERGIRVGEAGTLPAGAVDVIEPELPGGRSLRAELEALGVTVRGDAPGAIEVIASRVPLAPARIEDLRRRARVRPTALVALLADGFLEAVPEAALRISVCDATPLTRKMLAKELARRLSTRSGPAERPASRP